jgi:hypothetical protein
MRKTLFLLLAVCLLSSASSALACWRPIARDSDGDPDEYQAVSTHDEGGGSISSTQCPSVELRKIRELPESRRDSRPRQRRRFSITLFGRDFFLEK